MARKTAPSHATAAAYIRVSTEEQSLGPQAQKTAIEAWAKANGLTVATWHYDLGISGAADLDDRPGLQSALLAVESGEAGTLIVAKRDRLARDTLTAAFVERAVSKAGGRIVTADGCGNGTGPEAALMRSIGDAFAAYERELIRARTRAALATKKAAGLRAGTVPFGFRLGADGDTLEACPIEGATIAAARAHRDAGLPLRAVTAALAAEGHKGRTGSPLGLTQVVRLLAN